MAQDINYLLSERSRLQADINRVTAQLEYARGNSNPAIIDELNQRLASDEVALAAINAEIQITQNEDSAPTASAGQVAVEANPEAADGQVQVFTQDQVNQNIETGTDGRIRKIEETQATPPNSVTSFFQDDDQISSPGTATTQAGAGAAGDDAKINTKNSTQMEVDTVFQDGKVIPQPNVLDQYASYTYSASLYLMKPEAYSQLLKSKVKSIAGSSLLIQSAGAPISGRNEFFKNDYYIEKIELKSAITGKGTNAAHNVNNVKFTVIEPNGITLIGNLDRAVTQFLGSTGSKKNQFGSQIYLLVIKFYGYDDFGNLVQGGKNGAHVEKYYPLCISNVKFKIANKLVEYEFEATAPSYQIAVGQARGTIPYNVELGGITVKDALTGPVVLTNTATAARTPSSTDVAALNKLAADNGVTGEGEEPAPASAPPKATAASSPKGTIRQGLMTALNQYQQELVKAGVYTYPDKYSIEFVNASIEQAKIKRVGQTKKSDAPSVPSTAKEKLSTDTQSVDTNSRILGVTAGAQIVQFIDQVIRNSTYIEEQQRVVVNESTGLQKSTNVKSKNLAWYKISMQATPNPPKIDPKRNDYAYDIKYIVSAYKINDMASSWFYTPKYNGVHKEYNYWFTGENIAVLSYEQTYNALYSSVLSGGDSNANNIAQNSIKKTFQPASGQSSQGAAGRANEPAANAADYLYNPGDLANCTVQIIGDPAWLQQGEVVTSPGKSNFSFNPFLPDGTINFESQQILFEIMINSPTDYDLSTGLMNPNKSGGNAFLGGVSVPGQSKQSYVYIANECDSVFEKGKFTQTLKGSLLSYAPDQATKQAQATEGRGLTSDNPGSPANGTRESSSISVEDQTNPDLWNDGTAANDSDRYNAEIERTQTENQNVQPSAEPEAPTSSGDITSADITAIEENRTVPVAPQTASEAAAAVAAGSGYIPTSLTLEQQQIQALGGQPQNMNREA